MIIFFTHWKKSKMDLCKAAKSNCSCQKQLAIEESEQGSDLEGKK